jgi:DNA-binding transcriptional ArsR family regulator
MPVSDTTHSNGLLSRRGQVLLALASHPDLRLRELAEQIGMSPRGVQEVVSALVEDGFLERTRDGRRNRYAVRGEYPMPDEVVGGLPISALIDAMVRRRDPAPNRRGRTAIVLACSDSRYQEALRDLLAAEGLLGRSEMFLWPGGSSALAGPDAWSIVGAMERSLGAKHPDRIVLVAHQGCRVPGAFLSARGNPVATAHAIETRRRRGAELVKRAFDVEPEMWLLSQRGALRAHSNNSDGSNHKQGGRVAALTG